MVDIAQLKSWEGKRQETDDTILADPVKGLAALLDLEDVADYIGADLPACWHWLYFHDYHRQSMLGYDGHPALGGFLPPVPLPRRMWASGEIDIEKPLKISETVTKISQVESVEHKKGRSGDLIFVAICSNFMGNGGGKMTERHTIVYRAGPSPTDPSAEPQSPPVNFDWQKEENADTVRLFRYSALTFNSHRIHYDLDFCRNQEGYPGLIVHGPLIATLLANFAAHNSINQQIRRFSFRAISPLFHTAPFTIAGKKQNDHISLWATNHKDALAMTATAHMISIN